MRLLDSKGREVKTGDIVWRGGKAYVFLSIRNKRVDAMSTDGRKVFSLFDPKDLNLTLEASNETRTTGY